MPEKLALSLDRFAGSGSIPLFRLMAASSRLGNEWFYKIKIQI
jgi:hypothetical protein